MATDLHMMGNFRQPLGISDEILPDAWRNVKHCSAEDLTCKMEENVEMLNDPCTLSEYEYNGYEDFYSDGEYDGYGYAEVYGDDNEVRTIFSRRSRIRGIFHNIS